MSPQAGETKAKKQKKKTTVQFHDEHQCKNLQQDTSKLHPTIYSKDCKS